MGLIKYFDNNPDTEVTITDDILSLSDTFDLCILLDALSGKKVLVHLRVDGGQLNKIEKYLEEAVQEETGIVRLFIKWMYEEDGYLVELRRRMPDGSDYIIRLYQDGNGVIVYGGLNQISTYYFKIPNDLRRNIVETVSNRIDDIFAYPHEFHEDDRCCFPVHLKYNVNWKYPDADKLLGEYQYYESTEYGWDESEIDIAKCLLEVPEIKSKWLKMHIRTSD